jgi:hypothetical protein
VLRATAPSRRRGRAFLRSRGRRGWERSEPRSPPVDRWHRHWLMIPRPASGVVRELRRDHHDPCRKRAPEVAQLAGQVGVRRCRRRSECWGYGLRARTRARTTAGSAERCPARLFRSPGSIRRLVAHPRPEPTPGRSGPSCAREPTRSPSSSSAPPTDLHVRSCCAGATQTVARQEPEASSVTTNRRNASRISRAGLVSLRVGARVEPRATRARRRTGPTAGPGDRGRSSSRPPTRCRRGDAR